MGESYGTGEPKETPYINCIVQNTALATVTISIGLAAISLTIISISNTIDENNLFYISNELLTAILIIGEIFVLTSALTIDWFVDNFKH